MSALWRLLARQGGLRLLLSAGLISLVGDWILRIGLAYEVYALTGSTVASSAMLLASLLPQVLLGSVAGVFADRWDRRATMIVTNLLLAAGLLPLLLVHDAGRVWIVYPVALVESCLVQFFIPAESALLPHLVPAEDLVTANALNSQARDVARRVQALRVLLVFVAISSVGEGIMGTLMAPFVRDVLHGDSSAFGLIMSLQAVGGILGGLLAAGVGYRFQPARLVGWGAIAFGVLDLALFLYPLAAPTLWPAFLLIMLVGPAAALMGAGWMTMLQTATADTYRGRVFGAVIAIEGVATLSGAMAAGLLGGPLGIVPVIAVQGAGYVLAGLMVTRSAPARADTRTRHDQPVHAAVE